jgi:hypothetical protein
LVESRLVAENVKNNETNQTANVLEAVQSNETWVKKTFGKIWGLFGFGK